MELVGGKRGRAGKNISDVSKTNILSLDEIALEHILLKCDPASYMNLRCSCKRLYTLSLKCVNERTWEQNISKKLVHFLSTIIESSDVTNNEDHYYRNIRRYEYDVEPYIVRADIAELILSFLLQSIRLINFINCDAFTMNISPVIYKMIIYSLNAKDLHMKSIHSVFYILGVSNCYVFEDWQGRDDEEAIVLCRTIIGLEIFTHCRTRNSFHRPMVFYYMEKYKEWSTKGDPYRNSYDDVKGICERLSWRVFNNKETITPETLIELCQFPLAAEADERKFPLREDLNEGKRLYKVGDVLDASAKMKAIRNIKERLITNCLDFVAHLQQTELKKSTYDANDALKMLLEALVTFCNLSEYNARVQKFISSLVDSVEPFGKLFMASRKPFSPTLVHILSLVDVIKSNIGFYKEKSEKQLVFSVGSNQVAFRKAHGRGFLAIMNNRTFEFDRGAKTDEEKKNAHELLGVFNDHLNAQPSSGAVDEKPAKVTQDLLSTLCFHVLGF